MLFLFDIDGCLIESYMDAPDKAAAYERIVPLPGRREHLDRLRDEGQEVALVTNQGGVAFGYQTEGEVYAKLLAVLDVMGFPSIGAVAPIKSEISPQGMGPAYCYAALWHPKARLPNYLPPSGSGDRDAWRKPGAGMLRQAMRDYGYGLLDTLFVGDMASDKAAAQAAGVTYAEAALYFGDGTP